MQEFRDIFASNMTAIVLGVDVSDLKVKVKTYDFNDPNLGHVEKELKLTEAFAVIVDSLGLNYYLHELNSIWSLLYRISGLKTYLSNWHLNAHRENCVKVRNIIRQIVMERKSGK